jgi:uncharacterized protein YyaL (SSP411 family)
MRLLLITTFILTIISCNSSKKEVLETHQYTNDLIKESSPYLRQHAHNPVNWKAWNESTLKEAVEKQQLMIVSIGYAACHWCHVMEKESFEDSIVAAVMNDKFISVKVDREERPDVDQIYINAVQLMTGSAGWPLNVITLPDGRPVWGGTYFSKDDWINAIEKIHQLYQEEPQKLIDYADHLEEGIKSIDLITLNSNKVDFKSYDTRTLVDHWGKSFDHRYGGYNRAPKFMMPNNIEFLLRYAVQNNDAELLDYVTLTLNRIAYGGVYDQIGGGFARYSTDMKWHVPHFEKMLYDNAQLVSLYSNAFMVTKNPIYQQVVEETLEFISLEMTNEEGAFYSSLDADSETEDGRLEEGTFYIYTQKELRSVLKDDFELFASYYNVNSFGMWEHGNYVLIRNKSDEEFIEEQSITLDELYLKKDQWKSILLKHRNKKIAPRLDDKTLTSWNALMLKGYVDAYKTFGNEKYLETALRNAHFIIDKQLQDDGSLLHNYKDGVGSINGYLEDYAAVIDAFIKIYEVTLDLQWIDHARQLTDYAFEYFFDESKSMFYFTSSADQQLITRNFEYRDNVIPASNSIMAKNLMILSHHFDERNYAGTAKQMLKNVMAEMESYPNGYSNWLDLLLSYQMNYYEIVIVGDNAKEKVAELNALYLPNKLVAGSTEDLNNPLLERRYVDGETFIYVCVNNACKLPVTDVDKALELID